MNDLVYDYITAGVDMIISAVILSGVVLLLRGTVILNQYSANQQATAERVSYYKEYSIYDNTSNLSSADVISALVYYKDNFSVVIDISGNGSKLITWNQRLSRYELVSNGSITANTKSEDTMKGWISSTLRFHGQIIEDGKGKPVKAQYYQGGAITGLYFTKK